ncbi:MAG TPA: ATP-binding protein [Thermoclostridium caenicola]|nr:ATP-binding protein [Thermoclostridium caenicola]
MRRDSIAQLRKIARLVRNAPSHSAIILTDRNNRVILWNHGAKKLFGFRPEEVIGRECPIDYKPVGQNLNPGENQAPDTEADSYSCRTTIATRDGKRLTVYISASRLRESGRILGHLFVVEDLTDEMVQEKLCLTFPDDLERIVKKRTDELRERDAQIIQSAKMATLGEMATGVAHEINQPLGGISLITQGLLRALHKGKLTNAMLEDRLNAITAQIDRISKIITHLRTFGRQTPESLSKVHVNRSVMDVFDFVGQQLKNHNIKLDIDLDEKLSYVLADSNRLEQVLLNMITNARDAMDEQEKRVRHLLATRHPPQWAVNWEKKLFIRTYRDSGYVVIAIGDTGGGIPEEIRDKIFEPFFTTKEVNKGTGLGLSISYGIIREYGGDISLVTEIDQGSTFFIRLPALEA